MGTSPSQAISVVQVVCPPAFVAGSVAGITGPERRAANLAPQWKAAGVEVTVCYPRRGALWHRFADSGVNVVDYELRGKWDLRSVEPLRREIATRGATVVHTQGGPAVDMLGVRCARSTGIACVVTRPVMFEDHVGRPSRLRRIIGAVDRVYTLPYADAVIAVSHNGFDRLRARIGKRNLRLIYNGVKSIPSSDVKRASRRDGLVHVAMVGHLLGYKGWDDFLGVVRRLSTMGARTRWHIVGEGPERRRLEGMARLLGVDSHVVFHGLRHDVPRFLQSMDIFLLASQREGLSVAVLEAMSAELPIVATDVGGIRDQVVPGHNGFILPVGDVEGLAEKCGLLVEQAGERVRMGRASRERMQAHFSESSMLAGYVDIYRALDAAVRLRKRM